MLYVARYYHWCIPYRVVPAHHSMERSKRIQLSRTQNLASHSSNYVCMYVCCCVLLCVVDVLCRVLCMLCIHGHQSRIVLQSDPEVAGYVTTVKDFTWAMVHSSPLFISYIHVFFVCLPSSVLSSVVWSLCCMWMNVCVRFEARDTLCQQTNPNVLLI